MSQESPHTPPNAEDRGWTIALGQPFIEGVDSWPDGRFEYRIFGGGTHMLQFCMGKLKARDIEAFSLGTVHLGLAKVNRTLFMLFRIAGFMDWSDQAYHIQLQNPLDRELPPHEPNTHQTLNLVLVEAETGLVKGMRMVTWSRPTTAVMNRLLREQLQESFDKEEHARRVEEVYAKFPHSRDLVRAAIMVEKAGSQL